MTSCADPEQARKLAGSIMDAGLAACVTIKHDVESIYHWQGERQQDAESLLMVKTHTSVIDTLEQHIQAHHPYELPELIAVSIEAGSSRYLDWMDAQLNST